MTETSGANHQLTRRHITEKRETNSPLRETKSRKYLSTFFEMRAQTHMDKSAEIKRMSKLRKIKEN